MEIGASLGDIDWRLLHWLLHYPLQRADDLVVGVAQVGQPRHGLSPCASTGSERAGGKCPAENAGNGEAALPPE